MRYGLIIGGVTGNSRYATEKEAILVADWFGAHVAVWDYEAKMVVYRNW